MGHQRIISPKKRWFVASAAVLTVLGGSLAEADSLQESPASPETETSVASLALDASTVVTSDLTTASAIPSATSNQGGASASQGNYNVYNKVIFIDAGHGGADPGAVYENTTEKSLTLNMQSLVKNQLESEGYSIVTARDDNSYVDLIDRSKKANMSQADLFVSIHFNAATTPTATGIETYYYQYHKDYPSAINQTFHNNAERVNHSAVLANAIQSAVVSETGGKNNGVRRRTFAVLRETTAPAVLLELGYMSNSAELAKLKSPAYQQQLAQGIVDGIKKYYSYYGVTGPVVKPSVPQPVSSQPVVSSDIKVVAQTGTYTFTQASAVKSEPKVHSATLATYQAGQRVNYDQVVQSDNHRWLSYLSYGGYRRYVSIGQVSTPRPSVSEKQSTAVSQPVSSQPVVSSDIKVVAQTGTYTFTQASAVKSEPKVHSATLATYQAGQRVNYDQVVQSDNHHWLSYLSYGGYRRYVSLGQVSSPQSSVPAQPTTTPEKSSTAVSRPVVSPPSVSGVLKVISKTGTYTFTQPSAVKSEPKVHSATLATYQAGQRVNYDQVVQSDNHRWLSYISYGGHRRYVSIGQVSTPRPSVSEKPTAPAPQPVSSQPVVSSDIKVVAQTGTYTFTQASGVKSEPKVHSATLATYQPGQRVNYDQVVQSDNHRWLSYLSYGGHRRYVSIGQVSTPRPSVSEKPTAPAPQPVSSQPVVSSDIKVVVQTGTYTFTQASGVKSEPKVHSATLATYQPGQRVNYDRIVKVDNRLWLSYMSYGGYRRYVILPNS